MDAKDINSYSLVEYNPGQDWTNKVAVSSSREKLEEYCKKTYGVDATYLEQDKSGPFTWDNYYIIYPEKFVVI